MPINRPVDKGLLGWGLTPPQKRNYKIFWVYVSQTAIHNTRLARVFKGAVPMANGLLVAVIRDDDVEKGND